MAYIEKQAEEGIKINGINSNQSIIASWHENKITALQVETALNSVLEQTGSVSISAINKILSKRQDESAGIINKPVSELTLRA